MNSTVHTWKRNDDSYCIPADATAREMQVLVADIQTFDQVFADRPCYLFEDVASALLFGRQLSMKFGFKFRIKTSSTNPNTMHKVCVRGLSGRSVRSIGGCRPSLGLDPVIHTCLHTCYSHPDTHIHTHPPSLPMIR